MNELLVARTPLFSALPESEIKQLFASLKRVEFPENATIFHEGEQGDCFYIILEGHLQILKAMGTADERLLNTKGPGDHVGEMSFLIPDGLRTASVRSSTPVCMLEMTRAAFDSLLERWPRVAYDMARSLSQLLRESENSALRELREKNFQLTKALQDVHATMAQLVEQEKRIKESEARFRLLAEFAPFGVTLMNGRHVFEYLNPRFTEIFGYTKGEMPNVWNWFQLAYPEPASRASAISDWEEDFEVREVGAVKDRTDVIHCKDSGRKIVHIRSVVIGNGKFLRSYEDITHRKLAEDALKDSEIQLRNMSAQLMKTQEQERKRIAGELHDSVGQSLTAIKFGLENSLSLLKKRKSTAAGKTLEALVPIILHTMKETRRISKDLRPSILDDLGILATIQWFCREFVAIYTHIGVENRIDIQENEVPGRLKITIFRIIQEALNNIAKHSGADRVLLALRKTNGRIRLMIKDNGQGFDLKEMGKTRKMDGGLGLISMKERTALSGGAYALKTRVGKGTVVTAAWSCDA